MACPCRRKQQPVVGGKSRTASPADDPKYATEPLLQIDPVECIDCGACVPVCPVSAIFALDDLPEKWNEFTAKNAAYNGR
jgi:NAD-dependent dihydropyrimidine dehydrogenase PreA subunit